MGSLTTYMFLAIGVASLLLTEAWAESLRSRHLNDVFSRKGDLTIVNRKHVAGISIFLLMLLYHLSINNNGNEFLGINWSINGTFIILFLLATSCMAGNSSAENNSRKYAAASINHAALLRYLLIRIVFLVLYECFFRVVLLQFLIAEAGILPAILVNSTLYALAHLYSDRKEIIGTIPFGSLLCILTIYYGSIWPAILLHLCLAMSYELRLITNKRPPVKS